MEMIPSNRPGIAPTSLPAHRQVCRRRKFRKRSDKSRLALVTAVAWMRAALPAADAQAPPPGTYQTSWVGNTFLDEDQGKWVPDHLFDMDVAPDGTVFTAGFAEGGGGGAQYKDGVLQGRYSGFDSGFGDPAQAVTAGTSTVYFGCNNGVNRFGFGGGTSPNLRVLVGHNITGLAVKGGELFISDATSDGIRVYSTSSMTELRNWAVSNPGKIAVDANNQVWVIQTDGAEYPKGIRVLSYSSTGVAGPSISSVPDPREVAVNNQNQLLVGGLDADSQVRIYGNLGGTPSLAGTFGNLGGIFSGTPGQYDPLKFHWIKGLGVDSAGNIYVGCTFGGWWGQSVQAYAPSGSFLWDAHGTTFIDVVGLDPADESLAYGKEHIYQMDWTQGAGGEWSLLGFTVDRFAYFEDPRVQYGHGPVHRLGNGVRRIQGQLLLLCVNQYNGFLEMYRFNAATDGLVAIPSVNFGKPNQTLEVTRDENGNGTFESGESWNLDANMGHISITAAGDFVAARATGEIYVFPCQGLDPHGNPIYTEASGIIYPPVPELPGWPNTLQPRRALYDSAANAMYLGGVTAAEEPNAPGCRRLVRYDNWSGSRTKRWDITVPYEDPSYTPELNYGGGLPRCLALAGDYLFIGYGMGYVRIHNNDTGALVGTMKPEINGFSGGEGMIDADDGITAFRRASGEYVIFIESAGRVNTTMFRWLPPQFLSSMFSAGQIDLNWIGTGELEWSPAGLGPWTPVAPAPLSPYSEAVLSGENRFFRLKIEP